MSIFKVWYDSYARPCPCLNKWLCFEVANPTLFQALIAKVAKETHKENMYVSPTSQAKLALQTYGQENCRTKVENMHSKPDTNQSHKRQSVDNLKINKKKGKKC